MKRKFFAKHLFLALGILVGFIVSGVGDQVDKATNANGFLFSRGDYPVVVTFLAYPGGKK